MWKQVTVADTDGVSKVASLVYPLDSRAPRLSATDLEALLRPDETEAWLYSAGAVEMGVIFQFAAKANAWQLTYVGSAGSASLSAIVTQLSQRIGSFLQSKHLSFVRMTRCDSQVFPAGAELQTSLENCPLLQVMLLRPLDSIDVYQIEYLGPPGGDLSTAGQWLHVTTDTMDLVRRMFAVMYRMDSSFRIENASTFCSWPGHKSEMWGGAYYYWTADCEVVLRLNFLGRQGFEVCVGFVGNISPREALDLMIDRGVEYLKSQGRERALGRPSKSIKNQRLIELYDLLPSHPRVNVTVKKETPSGKLLLIDVPELAGVSSIAVVAH